MSSRYPPVRPAIGRPLATRAFARRIIKRHSATWVEEPSAEFAPQRTDGEARTGDRTRQEARRTATEGEFREPVNRQALGAVVGAAAQQDETNNTADAQPVLPVEAPPSMPFSVAQVRAALQRPASFESPQVARRQTDSGQPAPLEASTRAARPSQSPRASRPLPAQEPAPARRTSSQLVELGPADSQVVPKRPRDEPLRAADSLRVESRVDEGPEAETRQVEDKLTSAVQDEPAPPSGTPEAPVRRDLAEPPTDQGLLRRHKATPGEAPRVTAGQIDTEVDESERDDATVSRAKSTALREVSDASFQAVPGRERPGHPGQTSSVGPEGPESVGVAASESTSLRDAGVDLSEDAAQASAPVGEEFGPTDSSVHQVRRLSEAEPRQDAPAEPRGDEAPPAAASRDDAAPTPQTAAPPIDPSAQSEPETVFGRQNTQQEGQRGPDAHDAAVPRDGLPGRATRSAAPSGQTDERRGDRVSPSTVESEPVRRAPMPDAQPQEHGRSGFAEQPVERWPGESDEEPGLRDVVPTHQIPEEIGDLPPAAAGEPRAPLTTASAQRQTAIEPSSSLAPPSDARGDQLMDVAPSEGVQPTEPGLPRQTVPLHEALFGAPAPDEWSGVEQGILRRIAAPEISPGQELPIREGGPVMQVNLIRRTADEAESSSASASTGDTTQPQAEGETQLTRAQIGRLAEQVYLLLRKRLQIERERLGIPRR